jgi:hypothetical protein
MNAIKNMKNKFFSKLDIKDLSAVNFILGMEIIRDRVVRKISLN